MCCDGRRPAEQTTVVMKVYAHGCSTHANTCSSQCCHTDKHAKQLLTSKSVVKYLSQQQSLMTKACMPQKHG